MKFLPDISIEGKTVLLRLNLNVPIKDGKIEDDFRIRAVLETISYCAIRAEKTVIIAHLGRPEGPDPAYSLKPVAEHLGKLTKSKILFLPDCVGEVTRQAIANAPAGSIILLENLRFHKEERANDEDFGRELAKNGEIFINDAFGDSYKSYASVIWPPQVLPSAGGLRLKTELETLKALKESPRHPFVVIIGGAKIPEKMGVIESLSEQADFILAAGGVANTLLASQGKELGTSLRQLDLADKAKRLLQEHSNKIELPTDFKVMKSAKDGFSADTLRLCSVDDVKKDEAALDIGPETMKKYEQILASAETIFWAGPLGYTNLAETAQSSIDLLHALSKHGDKVYLGGGDTAALLEDKQEMQAFKFISTGGGAALKFLSGEELPGLTVLE